MLSSFTNMAKIATSGRPTIRITRLTRMSNRRLPILDNRRPDENPSEKISQLGLSVSRSTRPNSRSRKLEKSLTMTPLVLTLSRSLSGSELRRSCSARTTSLAPTRSTNRPRSEIDSRGTAVPMVGSDSPIATKAPTAKPLSGRRESRSSRSARGPAPSTRMVRRNASTPSILLPRIRLAMRKAIAMPIA